MIEAVLFDFNGVLVDDEAEHCEALQTILRDEAIMMSREEYYADYLGLDDRTGFVQAFRRANRTVTTEILNRLVEAKSRIYLRLVTESLRLVPGVREFVHDAHCVARLRSCSANQDSTIDSRSSLRRTMWRIASRILPPTSLRTPPSTGDGQSRPTHVS